MASLTVKLVALIGIFIALPVVLYGQFESADRQMRDLVTRAIRDRSGLIADALTPVLKSVDRDGQAALNEQLSKYASDGTVLKSRPLLLKATGVLAQALSFEVQ